MGKNSQKEKIDIARTRLEIRYKYGSVTAFCADFGTSMRLLNYALSSPGGTPDGPGRPSKISAALLERLRNEGLLIMVAPADGDAMREVA